MRSFLSWNLAILLGSLAAGCQLPTGPDAYPRDPLLLSKKPIEGTVASPTPLLLAAADPDPPPFPPSVLARRANPASTDAIASKKSVPAQTVSTSRKPVQAVPAVRIKGPEVPPLANEHEAALRGHAPDFRWLQGVVEKHSGTRLNLRYGDPDQADPQGGKVALTGNAHLTMLRDGDSVWVQGELSPGNDDLAPYPVYQVREFLLIKRK